MVAPAHVAPGVVIGEDYRVVELLREGGMGAVYLAEQLSTGAQRALKIMHRGLAQDPSLRRRFEQEARVGAQIESDFVVLVLGAGVDAKTQLPWLAMELLQGEDLGDFLATRGALAPEEAAEILAPLCDALGAAHRVGIVHRDLKPENLFLAKSRRPGERFTLKVLDFGIAKLVAEVQTSATGTLGTPMWMAPEQTATGEPITPATDVWPLGLLAFTLLTGRRYWLAANAAEVSLPALLREVALDPIEPASARAARIGALASLPAGFDEWFARCVVRDRAVRFQDAEEAWAALAPLLASGAAKPNGAPRSPATSGAGPGGPSKKPPEPTQTSTALPWSDTSAEDAARRAKYGALPPLEPPRASPSAAATTAKRPDAKSGARKKLAIASIAVAIAGAAGAVYGHFENQRLRRSSAATPSVTPSAIAGATSDASSSATTTSASVSAPSASSMAGAAQSGADEAAATKMITFPEAVFTMGSAFGADDEKPAHKVTVSTFLLDRTEVTAASYFRCVAAGACAPPAKGEGCNDASKPDHPINCVTWAQASTFCAWRGARLPTEAEWEYAAEGKDGRVWPWGNESPTGQLCWGRCATKEGTCAVGTHPKGATPEGVQDLAGNVWEWTASRHCPYADPECKEVNRTIRGGGWCGRDPAVVRCGARDGKLPTDRSAEIGFRCARSL